MAPQPVHYIRPEDNMLFGSRAILNYIHMRSIVTLYKWVEQYGFPAVKMPDGRWMSSITAIDRWLFLAAENDFAVRPRSRGANARSDIAALETMGKFGPGDRRTRLALDRVRRMELEGEGGSG